MQNKQDFVSQNTWYLLLDFDGVMITTPSWRPVAQEVDGFLAFNQQCTDNLADLLSITKAHVVLTTTHRIRFPSQQWLEIFAHRGLPVSYITKVNQAHSFHDLKARNIEVMQWVEKNKDKNFIILDDDKSLRTLPEDIKKFWIETHFHQGLTESCKQRALALMDS